MQRKFYANFAKNLKQTSNEDRNHSGNAERITIIAAPNRE